MSDKRIAISGKSGCGNTTASSIVAEQLGLRLVNFTFRNLAEERGKTLEEVMKLAKDDDYWDREVDNRQTHLAMEAGGCVLGSRLAIWLLKSADIKVYLRATFETRVRRIMHREGGTYEAQAAFTGARDSQDHERYLKLYEIDNDDYDFADLVIDTDELKVEDVARIILQSVGGISCT
jgi:cytidylate kinase